MNIKEAILELQAGKVVVATEELMGEKLFLKIGKDNRLYTTLDRMDADGDKNGFLAVADFIYDWKASSLAERIKALNAKIRRYEDAAKREATQVIRDKIEEMKTEKKRLEGDLDGNAEA